MNFSKYMAAVVVVFALAACGGGGGSAGTSSNGGAGSGSVTTPVPTVPSLTLAILSPSSASVNSISLGGGFVARATIKDATGAPLATPTTVTFSFSGSSIALLSPSTALTDKVTGIAEVTIAPASLSSIGASTLTASAAVAGVAVTSQMDFSVQASSLTLSAVRVGSVNLASGGNTAVQVTALIGGTPSAAVPVNVSFAASCGRINSQDTAAGGVSTTTNGSGISSAVYDAVSASGSLCSGPVNVTASSAGAASSSIVINVAVPTANAVAFISAFPAQIFVAGAGAVDQAIVKFKVLSSAGTALAGVDVKFGIVTNPGGVGLGSAGSTVSVIGQTNSNGEVSVSVFSGAIPGPVKVRAELVSSSTIFAETQNLTVASGPPSQRFMSLSVETYNIEGWDRDGTSTQLTVRLADRQGNAVNDGTVINFTAEGGQVARSCATAVVNGISQCSVNFVSQNPRPAGGRASVLAYTEGTKDYVDANGNNVFDTGDSLINIGDAYRDDNENGVFDGGEFLIPRGGSGASPCATAGGLFPSRLNTCDATLQTTVRQQTVILFSSTVPIFEVSTSSTGGVSFKLRSSTNTLLPVPLGTTVSAQATDSNTTDGATCAVDQVFGTPVPNVQPGTDPAADIATSAAVTLKDCRAGDSVAIKVKVPSGLETVFFVPLR